MYRRFDKSQTFLNLDSLIEEIWQKLRLCKQTILLILVLFSSLNYSSNPPIFPDHWSFLICFPLVKVKGVAIVVKLVPEDFRIQPINPSFLQNLLSFYFGKRTQDFLNGFQISFDSSLQIICNIYVGLFSEGYENIGKTVAKVMAMSYWILDFLNLNLD